MSALLILTGLLLALWGWLWLWQRAAARHWSWALAGVLPPLAVLSGLLHWRRTLLPLLLHLAGLVLLGSGLWQLNQAQPEHFARLLQGQWSDIALYRTQDGLTGRLQGQDFVCEKALLEQGVLILRSGQEIIASQEVRIDLSARATALAGSHFELDVLPTDTGDKLPMVEVLWQDSLTGIPEARRIQRGYTLRLGLQRDAAGTLLGDLHLSLPTRLDTVLSGRFMIAVQDDRPDPAAVPAAQPEVSGTDSLPVVQSVGSKELALADLLINPHSYMQQTVQVQTATGRHLQGHFQGINEDGELLIKQMIRGSGFVVYQVAPVDILSIRLED